MLNRQIDSIVLYSIIEYIILYYIGNFSRIKDKYIYTRVADNEVRMVTDEFCKPLHFVVHGQIEHIEGEFDNHFCSWLPNTTSIASLRNSIVNPVYDVIW